MNIQQQIFDDALQYLKNNYISAVIGVDTRTEEGGCWQLSNYSCSHSRALEMVAKGKQNLWTFIKTNEQQQDYPGDMIFNVTAKLGEHFEHVVIIFEKDGKTFFYYNETASVALGVIEMLEFQLKNIKPSKN